MQWVKSHLMIVIVGSIGVLSLTALALGYVLSTVGQELETDSRVLMSLSNTRPINDAVIEQKRKQQQEDARRLSEFLDRYKDAKQYTPLQPDVFTARDHMARTVAASKFQSEYVEKQQALLVTLKAKDQPSAAEFDLHVKNAIAEREKREREIRAGLQNTGVPVAGQPVISGLGQEGKMGQPGGVAGLGGMSSAEDETHTLRMGLAMSRARSILCYAAITNLDNRSEEIIEGLRGKRPLDEVTEEIWYAQMSLWVEQDVLGAIAELNNQVAKSLPEPQRWVANMPFKRLVQFAMGNYVAPAGAGGMGGMGAMGVMGGMRQGGSSNEGDLLTAGPTATFTNRGSTPSVDVVRFRMEMIVDARSILKVLNAISKAGFYTPVKVDFHEVVPQPTDYYIYGTAPIVDLTVVYEGCFLRNSYDKWMPEAVKVAVTAGTARGIGKNAGSATGGYGGPHPAATPGYAAPGGGGPSRYEREDYGRGGRRRN